MTDREKAIVTAYTGFCMLSGDGFRIFHEYIKNIMGRPVYTHELAYKPVVDEIKEKAKADFIALCAEQEPEIWSLDDAREDFIHDVYNTLDFLPTNNEANRIIDSFDRVTSGIEKESVLDKIRAEIAAYDDLIGHNAQVQWCLKVIDKHKNEKEESE